MPVFSRRIPSDDLARVVEKRMAMKLARGMRVRKISDDSILLEDLEAWVWQDVCLLQAHAAYELSFDVYATAGDTLPGVHALVTAHRRGGVGLVLALLLNVVLGACTVLWLAAAHKVDAFGLQAWLAVHG